MAKPDRLNNSSDNNGSRRIYRERSKTSKKKLNFSFLVGYHDDVGKSVTHPKIVFSELESGLLKEIVDLFAGADQAGFSRVEYDLPPQNSLECPSQYLEC